MNMFFAIIAKHFQKEDKAVEEQRLERAAQQAQQAQQVPGESQSMLEQIKARKRGRGMKPMGLSGLTMQQPKCVYVCQCTQYVCMYNTIIIYIYIYCQYR